MSDKILAGKIVERDKDGHYIIINNNSTITNVFLYQTTESQI